MYPLSKSNITSRKVVLSKQVCQILFSSNNKKFRFRIELSMIYVHIVWFISEFYCHSKILKWLLLAHKCFLPKKKLQVITMIVKPRPEAHMDIILFEVFLKSIDLILQQQILQRHYLYYRYIIDNVIVLSDLVESSGYSSKTLQKGSCPMCLWRRFYSRPMLIYLLRYLKYSTSECLFKYSKHHRLSVCRIWLYPAMPRCAVPSLQSVVYS